MVDRYKGPTRKTLPGEKPARMLAIRPVGKTRPLQKVAGKMRGQGIGGKGGRMNGT